MFRIGDRIGPREVLVAVAQFDLAGGQGLGLAADEDVSDHPKGQIRAAQRYEMACEQSGIWDFEGIVLAAVRLLREHPEVAAVVKARFPVVIVDEYQDLGAEIFLSQTRGRHQF